MIKQPLNLTRESLTKYKNTLISLVNSLMQLESTTRSHHTKKGNPLRVTTPKGEPPSGTRQNMASLKKNVPALRDNYSMEVDLLKYSHTSHESASIVDLFQWHDGQHCCETDNEGIFTCEWSLIFENQIVT